MEIEIFLVAMSSIVSTTFKVVAVIIVSSIISWAMALSVKEPIKMSRTFEMISMPEVFVLLEVLAMPEVFVLPEVLAMPSI